LQSGKERRPWLPPIAALLAGIIAFSVIFLFGYDIIGAAGVGVIVFVITWLNLRKIYG
jgi:hypothetical protein